MNTYTKDEDRQNPTSALRIAAYSAINTSAAAHTVTITQSGTGTFHGIIAEFDDIETVSHLDVDGSAEGDALTTLNAGDLTTTNANDLLVTACAASANVTYTIPTDYIAVTGYSDSADAC